METYLSDKYNINDYVRVYTDKETFTGYISSKSILGYLWVMTDSNGKMEIDLNTMAEGKDFKII